MKKKRQSEELISLTKPPLMDFTIEELEQRLETDPLFLGNLFNLTDGEARCGCKNECKCDSQCVDKTCDCNGVHAGCPDASVG